ncbi:MAG: chromosome segregation protein SMC, partial [Spirochaetaceae bacterium]|nr:chromosome segregation protein SMC [Spirochaetaceae bacterium]
QVNDNLAAEEQHRETLQENLRTLTDDIVRELDRGLKDSGYDRNTRRKLEQSILDSLKEVRIRSEGRSKLLSDQKNLSDGTKAIKLLESASDDFLQMGKSIKEISGLFTEYKDSEADFLEEFLAPEGIITRKRDLDEKITGSAENTRKLKGTLESLIEEKAALAVQINESRESLEGLRVAQARTTTQAAAAEDSLSSLDREAESEELRLGEIRQQLAAEESRIRSLDDQVTSILSKREDLEKSQEKLRKDMAGLETGISSENEKMTGRENKLKKLTEHRGSLDIEKERIRLEMEHLDNEIKLLLEDFRDRNSRDLNEFSELRESIKQTPKQIREQFNKTRAELKNLGQVNLMAPEEFKEVAERHSFLSNQLEDLKKAQEHLSLVTEEIRKESASLFLKTFKEIKEHFHEMFRRLFGGGRAEIRLIDPEDPLSSGLEIYAQPPGKKLENISLLSGGEKSLCGVALMFATFQVKPSPFCILDEIDAALDEANIQRFVNLLSEFGKKSQFVVITHNKKTVAGAKTLLGVTMQESGVSRLITMRLDEQEQGNEESIKTRR